MEFRLNLPKPQTLTAKAQALRPTHKTLDPKP